MAGLIIFTSCVKEADNVSGTDANALPAVIKIGTRSGSVDLDDEIISLRIIVFQPDGVAISNMFYGSLPRDIREHEITLEISAGTYDFVFIANENNGSEISALRNYHGTKSRLEDISLPSSLFSGVEMASVSPVPIPMFLDVDNVEVLPGVAGVKINGAPTVSEWNVTLKKLGVRIDMVLKSKMDLAARFDGVRFSNLPDNVPLVGAYGGAVRNTVKEYKISAGSLNFASPYTLTSADISDGYVWGVSITRVILPSHLFIPKNDPLKRAKMEVIFLGWNEDYPSANIGHNDADNFTLQPDTYYKGEGIIAGEAIPVYITPESWTDVNIAGSVNFRMLNVSTTEVLIYDDGVSSPTPAKNIYFNSNQSVVSLEANAKNSAGAIVATTTLFENIDANLSYDQATGAGSLQLRPLSAAVGGIYTIYLNANGLVREIKVIIAAAATHAQYANSYVGAFYRHNQTGERRISIPATPDTYTAVPHISGDWVAVVDNDNNEWIKIDKEDFGSNSGTLINSAKHYVYGRNASAAQIKFRIGLTGYHPKGSAAGILGDETPRYGLIRVYYGSNLKSVHYIYVRQGEAADYLMRVQDPINITSPTAQVWSVGTRKNAVRFSPYNLTDPNVGTGSNNLNNGSASYYQIPVQTNTNREAYFVDFPSMAGYFFKWLSSGNQRKALHPTNPGTGNSSEANISNYGTETLSNWSTARTSHETCPQGFRRFSDNTGSNINEYGDRIDSEMRQSLWLNPFYGGVSHSVSGQVDSDNTDNSISGYLADGYFDVNEIEGSVSNTGTMEFTKVGSGNSVAYMGRLFYNPYTNASLFFPFTGFRKAAEQNMPEVNGSTDSPGALVYTGFEGNYWSSTRLDSNNNPYPSTYYAQSKAWFVNFGSTWAKSAESFGGNACPIRCVVGGY